MYTHVCPYMLRGVCVHTEVRACTLRCACACVCVCLCVYTEVYTSSPAVWWPLLAESWMGMSTRGGLGMR